MIIIIIINYTWNEKGVKYTKSIKYNLKYDMKNVWMSALTTHQLSLVPTTIYSSMTFPLSSSTDHL